MGDLLTIDNLQLFLTFAVPGIVTVYFRSQFLTGRMPPLTEGLASNRRCLGLAFFKLQRVLGASEIKGRHKMGRRVG